MFNSLQRTYPNALGLPAVLCHGDLWVGNLIFEQSATLIFKRDTCLASKLLAIIDWQLAYAGNCI